MKKILSVILAIAVTICFIPEFSFAASENSDLPYGLKAVTMSSKVFEKVKHQGNELEILRQQALDVMEETWDESVFDKDQYAPAVYSELTSIYQNACNQIRNATKITDFIQESLFGYALSDDLLEAVDMIEYLGTLTKQNGVSSISKCVSDVEKYRDEVFAKYKMSTSGKYSFSAKAF